MAGASVARSSTRGASQYRPSIKPCSLHRASFMGSCMSGICGYFGTGDPAWLAAMLAAIGYRGDTECTFVESHCALGYRFWRGRPGKAQTIFAAADGARTVAAGT